MKSLRYVAIVSGKLLVGLLLVVAVTATVSNAAESMVWVPAEAVATDAVAADQEAEEVFSGTSEPESDSRVVQASYEEPVASTARKTKWDFSDPGLVIPLEDVSRLGWSGVDLIGDVVEDTPSVYRKAQYLAPVMTTDTMASGSMVPGSMRVLQTSDPMMTVNSQPWEWQILPSNLLWHSYLAGPREPRISATFVHITKEHGCWDSTLGGRASILRFGNTDPETPEGVEIQIEGAAFPRLTLDYDRDLVAADYRFGFPLVYRRGAFEAKFSYYHLSSHFGDEYLIKHPEMIAQRINYSRDALTLAVGYFPWRDLRLYAEMDYAMWCDGGSRPWGFQFGVDYSPVRPTSIWGAPFFAVNAHLHQEHNYGGGLTAQAGIQWRGQSSRLLRFGFQYFNGMSEQYQFYHQFEQQIGGGVWYDF